MRLVRIGNESTKALIPLDRIDSVAEEWGKFYVCTRLRRFEITQEEYEAVVAALLEEADK